MSSTGCISCLAVIVTVLATFYSWPQYRCGAVKYAKHTYVAVHTVARSSCWCIIAVRTDVLDSTLAAVPIQSCYGTILTSIDCYISNSYCSVTVSNSSLPMTASSSYLCSGCCDSVLYSAAILASMTVWSSHALPASDICIYCCFQIL